MLAFLIPFALVLFLGIGFIVCIRVARCYKAPICEVCACFWCCRCSRFCETYSKKKEVKLDPNPNYEEYPSKINFKNNTLANNQNSVLPVDHMYSNTPVIAQPSQYVLQTETSQMIPPSVYPLQMGGAPFQNLTLDGGFMPPSPMMGVYPAMSAQPPGGFMQPGPAMVSHYYNPYQQQTGVSGV